MIIEELDGTRYDIADYSLRRLFHRIPSADVVHNHQTVEGKGTTTRNSFLDNRIIPVEFLYETTDIYDYYLLRDQLNALFMRTEPFYIIFKREPYKRWLVKTEGQFEVPPHPHMQSFEVSFLTQQKYAESTVTTSDAKEWDVDKWGWNGAIDWDSPLQYTFLTNSFVVKNLGNVEVDPREIDFEIAVKATASNHLQITNETTGDIYRFNGALSSTDNLILSGVRTLKNGVSAFGSTNKKLLTLAVGDNHFIVEGGTVHSIAFNFRFPFK